MPRPSRIDYQGALHHVMNRGAAKRTVFPESVYFELFLGLLADAAKEHRLQIHAYCLMSNHFHLLVESDAGELSEAMRDLTGRFTRIVNGWNGEDGPIFRGRFKSVPVRSERQFLLVSRYIHLNPAEAGLVQTPVEWPWSSAAAYLRNSSIPQFLSTDRILQLFEPSAASREYAEFLAAGLDTPTARFYGRERLPARFPGGAPD